MSCMDDLQQISGFRFCQRDEHPLVQNEQVRFLPLGQHLLEAALASGYGQFLQQLRKSNVAHRKALLAGFHAQCAADVGLTATGGTHNDNIVPFLDILTGSQCFNEGSVQQTARGVIDIGQAA